MPKNTQATQERQEQEQEHSAIVVSAGGATQQHTLRKIGLIIGREYKNRVTQRSFIISTIIMLVFVIIAACVPTIIQFFASSLNSQTKVAVVNNAGPIAGLNDNTLTQYIGTTLNGTNAGSKPPFAIIQSSDSPGSLQNQVKNGGLNILLVLDRTADQNLRFTYYTNAGSTGDSNLPKVQALAQQLSVIDAAHRLGLTQTQTASLFAQPGFTVVSTAAQTQDTRSQSEIVAGYIIAYAGNVLIYMAVFLYGMGVAVGVAEEKGSRVMEILVNAATPFQLLAGKIIGIGAAGLTQMVCIVAVGIGTLLLQSPLQTAIFGTNGGGINVDIAGVTIGPLLLLLLYFILGFLLYATLFAAMGALVKRQDEVQNAVAPITWLLVIGYIVSFIGIYTPDAPWMRIMSYIPFWTPTTMLVRVGVSSVAWWEIALTVVLMSAAILVCTWISARIYRQGILMYGQKPGLGQLARLLRAK